MTRRIQLFLAALALLSSPLVAGEGGLYQTFGQRDGIERIMARTADLAFTDPRTAKQFEQTRKDRLIGLLTDQVCEALGGPCVYKGLNMKKAHVKLGITEAEFNALVEQLQQAMDEAGVPFHAQNKLLAVLAPMKRDMVER